ncbi:recombinase family protein [Bacillus halotolerans]|uniref:recombinase family protein n=1 Tax=Bacillus halotolerans TaxID=260554 RepID=UPI0025706AE6|nr:recombinase family protein [Bacillus halotolerans]WJE43101.1 recombinase family protein [Bacillus halotolerans]
METQKKGTFKRDYFRYSVKEVDTGGKRKKHYISEIHYHKEIRKEEHPFLFYFVHKEALYVNRIKKVSFIYVFQLRNKQQKVIEPFRSSKYIATIRRTPRMVCFKVYMEMKAKFDGTIVWKIPRLSRSLYDTLTLLKRFEEFGVQFVSYSEKFDTSTPIGRLALQLMEGTAEMERNTLSSNVELGMKQKALEGGVGTEVVF